MINRVGIGDSRVNVFCREKGIEVLAEIPDDRAVAESYAAGMLLTSAVPGFSGRMADLLGRVERAGVTR